MISLSNRTVLFAALLMTGAAHAQTPSAKPRAEVPVTRDVPTPQNGVARGVIRPSRPVDSDMVTKPPAVPGRTMPVITPEGTAS